MADQDTSKTTFIMDWDIFAYNKMLTFGLKKLDQPTKDWSTKF